MNDQLLKKNIKALEKLNEYASNKIKGAPDNPDVYLIYNTNKDANILFKIHGRAELAYPEDMSPKTDAKNVVKGASLHNENFTVLIGIGAGHLLYQMLLKKESKHHVLLIEPKPEVLKIAFSVYDFTKFILDGSLLILIPEKKEDIMATFGLIEGTFVTEGWAFYTEKYITKFPEIYTPVIEDTMAMINSMQCNIGTVCGAGAEIAKNDILNLPYAIKHRGVSELKDLYKGMPCVSIATGPSLARNIHLLLPIQDKVIIIAVAQALRLLLAYGIKPDFITTVDYGKTNIEHFIGLMDCDVPMVCLNRTYAEILKKYQGPKFIVGTPVPGFDDTTVGIIAEKGNIEAGGSVSHMSLGLATHLGCNPITLMGHDMGYEDIRKSHVDGADASGKVFVDDSGMLQWNVDDPRSHLSKEKTEKEATFPMGGQYVEGYWEKPIMTNNGLVSFINAFEMIGKTHKDIELYNSTEGGANIKEYKKILLKDFISKYCNETINKEVVKPLLTLCDDGEKLIESATTLLKVDIKLFEDIIENCKKALEVNIKLKTEKDNNEKFLLMKKNEKYSVEAQELTKKNNLMGVAIYYASRAIYSRKYSIGDKTFKSSKHAGKHLSKNEKDLETAISRNEMILEAAQKAAEEFLKQHKDVLELLEKYQETKDESLLTDYSKEEVNLDDAEKYLETGNWAHVFVDLEKSNKRSEAGRFYKLYKHACEMRDESIKEAEELQKDESRSKLLEYFELVEQAHEIGRKDKNFTEALVLLNKAIELFPGTFKARWGASTALVSLGEIDKALENYTKLIEDFPEHKIVMKFEYACTLIQKDVKAGLIIMTEIMQETEQYDHMFLHIGKLYEEIKMEAEAIQSYETYVKKYSADIRAWERLEALYLKEGDFVKYKDAKKKISLLGDKR